MTYQNSTNSSSKDNQTLEQTKILPPVPANFPPSKQPIKRSTGLSLRAKVVLIAIALGVIPVTIIGAITYKVTESHLSRQINHTQRDRTHHLSKMFERFVISRANEAETLATSPIFTNPNVISTVTLKQKKAALDAFQDRTGFYDSIVYLDLQGNPLFQSQTEHPLRGNYSDRQYFQKAIEDKKTTLNEVGISSLTGKPRVEFAVPVKNAWTDRVIGILRFKIPSEQIIPLLASYAKPEEQWHLINTQGLFFASTINNLENRPLATYFPQLQQAHLSKQTVTDLVDSPEDFERQQIINYVPIKVGAINPDLNLGTAIALDTDVAFETLKPLRWIYFAGTIATALIVGSIAGFLANRIVQPLLRLTAAVGEISQGKLDTRIKLDRLDELALLGEQINDMAQQLDLALQRQKTIARTSELMARMAQARSSRELQLPFSLFLSEVRHLIKSDRLIFYQFDPKWQGTVIAESVAQGFPRTLGAQFEDPCFAQEYVRKYQRGRIQSVTNIYQANLSKCHLQQLEPYSVKASLVLPVIIERSAIPESQQLIGLLIAHQCSDPRIWSQSDVDYLQQTAYQLAMVLRGYIDHREENSHKTGIQKDLALILSRVQDLAQGDLGIDPASNASSKSDLVKSFDSAIDNLRRAIAEIQTPTKQINTELIDSKRDLTDLKDRLKQQTNQLALIFAFIEQMAESVAEITSHVSSASETVNCVVTDLESEKINFSRAIAFMSHLETNIRNNTNRVKSLDAASQKMTKVIGSIRKINLRASLLVSKLSKRIPEELDNSALSLKEEVQSIQQSIAATKELENVVRTIDNEIAEVLREYQGSENQLEQENYLVANTGESLEQIIKITKNAQQHLFSLVNLTNMQSQTSQKINNLQGELKATSTSIAILSDRAIDSLESTTLTAKDLENVVNFFKLE